MRRRRMTLVAVAASMLVAIVGACGGGGGDGVAFDGETVRSGDGVLTVQILTGAAADGVEIEVTRIAEDELPPELQGIDGVVVVGYELGPDGAQFSQPVMLTFRVAPADHGIDLPEGAVPLALLLTRNTAGDLESLPGEVSHEDGEIVVRAAVTHFSPALLVLSIHEEVALEPAKIELAVGGSREVEFVTRDPLTGDKLDDRFEHRREWTATPPFEVTPNLFGATISCTAPTDGWVLGAYRIFASEFSVYGVMQQVFGDFAKPLGIKLAGDGKCNGPATATPTGSTSTQSSGDAFSKDAVPSGSSSSGGSSSSSSGASSRSGPAVVIQPCLVIDQARATSLMGIAVGPVGVREEERDKSCGWNQSPGADPTVSTGLFMTISRNSARGTGMLEAWRTYTPDATEVRSVPWTELGELRIEINKVGDEFATVMLFALAFSSDASSGDVYLMLVARGPVHAAESNAALLLTVAEELRDGVLAAQR